MDRPIVALSLLALLFLTALPILTSAEVAAFDPKAFADAQVAGKSIVVAVNASW